VVAPLERVHHEFSDLAHDHRAGRAGAHHVPTGAVRCSQYDPAGLRTETESSRAYELSPDSVLVLRFEHARLPSGSSATDVFGVHEILEEVHSVLNPGPSPRTEGRGPPLDALQEVVEASFGVRTADTIGPPLESWDQHAEAGIRSTFARDQMRGQV
jgi:hypothetical protein